VKLWKDCCRRECTESKNSILGSIEELPQGVCAGVFFKTRVVEEKLKNNLCLKTLKGGAAISFHGWTSFAKEHFVHFAGIVKEEFDSRNSPWRIHKVPRTIRSYRGVRKLHLGEIGPLDHLRNSFRGFGS
jgi:hypothetical protein